MSDVSAKIGAAPDYSRKDCWYQIPDPTKVVDTFYIYATNYIMSSLEKGAPEYASLDNAEMLEGVKGEYVLHASAFADSTNVFMPYYRQAGMPVMKKAWKETGNCEAAISGLPYSDIAAALDYYFENCNGGRPFIIAGHSQGSCMTKFVLKNYFKEHPEYYARMVAAYVIGYSITRQDLEEYPHLKFAEGADDVGVIVSWNIEGPGNKDKANIARVDGAISINPINWKLDDTYASAEENPGSRVPDPETNIIQYEDIGADAQVDTERGVVICHADYPFIGEGDEATIALFGPESFHNGDYTFYFNSIRQNVADRIEAYFSQNSMAEAA